MYQKHVFCHLVINFLHVFCSIVCLGHSLVQLPRNLFFTTGLWYVSNANVIDKGHKKCQKGTNGCTESKVKDSRQVKVYQRKGDYGKKIMLIIKYIYFSNKCVLVILFPTSVTLELNLTYSIHFKIHIIYMFIHIYDNRPCSYQHY